MEVRSPPVADAAPAALPCGMPHRPNMLIRRAHPDDAATLRDVLHDTYERVWLPRVTLEAAQAFRDQDPPAAYVAGRWAKFWVAELDGRVVGFADWEADFVKALHVCASHARVGVGSRLMDKVEAEIASAGFTELA